MRKIFVFFFLFTKTLYAQQTLSITDFLNTVKKNHPIAKQAELLKSDAVAQRLAARGGCDPKLTGDWQAKEFKEQRYFQTSEYGVKIPTWFGVEVKGMYKTAQGDFLNPEEKLPKIGQAVVGISAPLLQGLLIDERRAALFRARIVEKSNENERQIIVNNLLLEAAKAYFEWFFAAKQLRIQEKAVVLAEKRLSDLKISFRLGDKPAVDTLEAFIQVQERVFDLNEAKLLLQNENLQLSNFLWTEKQQPYTLPSDVQVPIANSNETLPFLQNDVTNLALNHPELVQYTYKIKQLEIEKRLKQDKLKPKLNVEYNLLGNGRSFYTDALLQNYKYGVNFSFPILLRQERGNLQMAQIKLDNVALQSKNKQIELQNKINTYFNELNTNRQQLSVFANVFKSYESLLDAENQKFAIGESSVFLVNARERKLIETEIKLLKIEINQQKLFYALKWAAGKME
jgi:outer membrane protein TolC